MNEEDKPKQNPQMKKPRPLMAVLIVLTVFIAVIVVFNQFNNTGSVYVTKSYTEFIDILEKKQMESVELVGYEATGVLKKGMEITRNGKKYSKVRSTFQPGFFEGKNATNVLSKHLPDPSNYTYSPPSMMTSVLVNLIPWVFIIFIAWFFFFRQIKSSGGPGGVLNFGKSRAKFVNDDQKKITFKDVAGIDESKEEVSEVISFLKDNKKFKKLGGRAPRGVLLVGPPGTGKTLLAKAIAGEANVPFLSICGSDFVEMFVGVGASRVRDLFRQAKESAPCIIFLDEIDAVGRRRGTGLGGGHDEREQTLNAILVEMDGFETDAGVIVMASTNRPDVLDPALLRPGRFDRQVAIDLPDIKGRAAILEVHARKIKMSEEVDLHVLAKTTPGFSGADLEAVINEGAIHATMLDKEAVELVDLENARDKVRWGRQKKSRVMDKEDLRITAYHETGHAIIAELIPEIDSSHKVTIIPQGRALGATMVLPEKDQYHVQKKFLLGTVTMMFGGRVAEEVFCKDISSGASDDIKRATELVHRMVCEWGMSETLGAINYSENEEHSFLGHDIGRKRNHSEDTAQKIDLEVKKILESCLSRSRELINANKDSCEKIAETLLEREVLTGDEIRKILSGESLPKKETGSAVKESAKSPISMEQQIDPDWRMGKEGDPAPA